MRGAGRLSQGQSTMAGHALCLVGFGAADDGQFDLVRDHLDSAQADWPPPRRAASVRASGTAARGLDLDRDLLASLGPTALCPRSSKRGHDYHPGPIDNLPSPLGRGTAARASIMAFGGES